MIAHTKSYLPLKSNTQEAIDFVILVTHSVPALCAYMKAVERKPDEKPMNIPMPDLPWAKLSPESHERLREIKQSYKKSLGKYLVLSTFSYFEAYIVDVLGEIIAFHNPPAKGGDSGGPQPGWSRKAKERILSSLQTAENSHEVLRATRKLRGPYEPGQSQRNRVLHQTLASNGYPLPGTLLVPFAVAELTQKVKNLKSVDVPDILSSALLFDLTGDESTNYTKYRNLRNGIAHGRTKAVDLKKAMGINEFFRGIAVRLDQHIVKLFLLQEDS
ncbi:HEPN domain-containing protein [Enhygromyxa salina]|uniref:HEPN domain-containing protein n=1 Tax=Enhygromyxa salina TaxID=215803 RepID=UPI0011BA7832|nr:HEPN domain-containing protein [Enhygromyxa salina]